MGRQIWYMTGNFAIATDPLDQRVTCEMVSCEHRVEGLLVQIIIRMMDCIYNAGLLWVSIPV